MSPTLSPILVLLALVSPTIAVLIIELLVRHRLANPRQDKEVDE